MRYLLLSKPDRAALLRSLEEMPAFIASAFGDLSAEAAAAVPGRNLFAPVEHCWHLADLEREGFATRIERLLGEIAPVLEDFDGGVIARQRRYRTLSLADAVSAFRVARRATLDALKAVPADAWTRSGVQGGVGPVSLCDVPLMMAEHDATHRAEIAAWLGR